MATYGAAPEDGGLPELFEASPDRPVHTSFAAEMAFLIGLVAICSAPFSVMHAVTFAASVLGFFFGFVGTATTSRPYVAGRGLAPAGLFFAFVALVLVALRYFNVDTAFGDELVPTIRGWLDDFNSWLPLP
jgi:hypothetical protein